MYTLSVIGLSICLVYISIIMQEAEAQNCSDSRIYGCASAASSAIAQAPLDNEKKCSVGNTYLECLTKFETDCNLDTAQMRFNFTEELSKYCGSGNGAGSIIFTFLVLCFGLAFYKLV